MTTTKETVRNAMCASQEEAQLFDAVIEQAGGDWEEIYNSPEDYRDPSAGVPGFTYYSDTEPFAKENILNIIYVLQKFEQDCGVLEKNIDDLLNWYAWYALEHIIQLIMDYKEMN